MKRFREISETTIRRMDRIMLGLAGAETIEELESQFLAESGKILPADCLCWNTWAADWSNIIACQSNEEHDAWFLRNHEVFSHYVGHHPVLATNHISVTAQRVIRMSDCQSPTEFKSKNPFFREVYRHLGFVYQVCYTAASLEDRKIILSWSREMSDFSDADLQVFHLMGQRLGIVSRRVDERQRLATGWQALCSFVDARLPVHSVRALGTSDARLLAKLLQCKPRQQVAHELGIRRDTMDKQLGSIRERLGLENHHQLLSALAELKSAGSGKK